MTVIRSTVPPGTSLKAAEALEERSGKRCGFGFELCHNPGFLREGSAVDDRRIYGPKDLKQDDYLHLG